MIILSISNEGICLKEDRITDNDMDEVQLICNYSGTRVVKFWLLKMYLKKVRLHWYSKEACAVLLNLVSLCNGRIFIIIFNVKNIRIDFSFDG